MPSESLSIGAPFFGLTCVTDEASHAVDGRFILINLGDAPVTMEAQTLPPLTSVIVQNTILHDIGMCLLIDGFDRHADEAALMRDIRATWPTAYQLRGEERLKGVAHYMSPKQWIGQIGFTLYHSASVPLNVGLHREHPFCPVPGFREVHTQIVGLGKMQQCREASLETLYLEEVMAPGVTHRPMFNAQGRYPWHQFETITPSVFLAVEMLPEGAAIPA